MEPFCSPLSFPSPDSTPYATCETSDISGIGVHERNNDTQDIDDLDDVYKSYLDLTSHIFALYKRQRAEHAKMDDSIIVRVCSIIACKFVETDEKAIDRLRTTCMLLECDASVVYDAEFHVLETIDWRPLKGFELVKKGW